MRKIEFVSLGLLFALCSCISNPDGGAIPIIPFPSGGSGGSVTASRAEPMAPLAIKSDSGISYNDYEQHGAVNSNDCYQMELRFKKEGRKVTLVKVVPNPLNKGGGVLNYLCLFDGEDAEKETSVFEDYRYNSPDEYTSP